MVQRLLSCPGSTQAEATSLACSTPKGKGHELGSACAANEDRRQVEISQPLDQPHHIPGLAAAAHHQAVARCYGDEEAFG